MVYSLRAVKDEDWPAAIAIYNHYVVNSWAAFIDKAAPLDFFLKHPCQQAKYPIYIIEQAGKIVGFGLMRAFFPPPTFSRSAELAYFIHPEHTRGGIGGLLLERFRKDSVALGVDTWIACITSENLVSQNFHKKHGFKEAGLLARVCRKAGKDLGMVYMQKFLT